MVEEKTSDEAWDLPRTSLSLEKIFKSLADAITTRPDLKVTLADGEVLVDEKLLVSRCETLATAIIANSGATGPASKRPIRSRSEIAKEHVLQDSTAASSPTGRNKKRKATKSARVEDAADSDSVPKTSSVVCQAYSGKLNLPGFS